MQSFRIDFKEARDSIFFALKWLNYGRYSRACATIDFEFEASQS